MFRWVALLAVLLPGPVARADDLKAAIDPLAEAFLKGKTNAGVVVGVYRAGTPRVFGYGTVVLRTGKATPAGDTLFAVGSVTKGFTGILLAEAVRRGEVRLDDPANKHLPGDLRIRPHKAGGPTLLDLATHRSGLPVQPPLVGLLARDPRNPYADFDRKKLAWTMARLRPPSPPGKEHEYSNLGAGLLGHALVHAAGASSYDRLVKDRVCQPLGLADTAEALTGGQLARLARGHSAAGEVAPHWDFASLEGCGALRSTADDLLKLAAAVIGDARTDLAPALAQAVEPRRPAGGGDRVGLFWMVTEAKGKPPLVWHNGGTTAARAMVQVEPATRTAVVVLCAREDEEADGLANQVLEAVTAK